MELMNDFASWRSTVSCDEGLLFKPNVSHDRYGRLKFENWH